MRRDDYFKALGAGESAEDIDLELSSPDYPKMNGILKLPCDEGVILAALIAAAPAGRQAMDSDGDDSGFEHGVF